MDRRLMAAWHLRMLGAEVVKVELPESAPARNWGTGAVFDLLNARKRCAVVDFGVDEGRSAFAQLCERTHVILAGGDLPAAAIAWEARRPASIVVIGCDSVPDGSGTAETLVRAAFALTSYVGEPGGPPVRVAADISSVTCAAHATQAALAGLQALGAAKPQGRYRSRTCVEADRGSRCGD